MHASDSVGSAAQREVGSPPYPRDGTADFGGRPVQIGLANFLARRTPQAPVLLVQAHQGNKVQSENTRCRSSARVLPAHYARDLSAEPELQCLTAQEPTGPPESKSETTGCHPCRYFLSCFLADSINLTSCSVTFGSKASV